MLIISTQQIVYFAYSGGNEAGIIHLDVGWINHIFIQLAEVNIPRQAGKELDLLVSTEGVNVRVRGFLRSSKRPFSCHMDGIFNSRNRNLK